MQIKNIHTRLSSDTHLFNTFLKRDWTCFSSYQNTNKYFSKQKIWSLFSIIFKLNKKIDSTSTRNHLNKIYLDWFFITYYFSYFWIFFKQWITSLLKLAEWPLNVSSFCKNVRWLKPRNLIGKVASFLIKMSIWKASILINRQSSVKIIFNNF